MSMDVIEEQKVTFNTDEGEHDLFSHYAKKIDIERSMFEGVEITALCGKTWRPSRDFTKYPICPTCKEMWENFQDA
jgi:hypothetical protein